VIAQIEKSLRTPEIFRGASRDVKSWCLGAWKFLEGESFLGKRDCSNLERVHGRTVVAQHPFLILKLLSYYLELLRNGLQFLKTAPFPQDGDEYVYLHVDSSISS
jgi:hypothetical protein